MGLPGYLDNQIAKENSNEFVIYRAAQSWIPIILRIIPVIALFCVVGGFVWFGFGLTAGLLTVLAGVIIAFAMQSSKIIDNLGVDIVVTNKYLRCKRNLISVSDDKSSSLSRIDDIDVDYPTVFNRLFGYGNIEIQTINGSDDFFKFTNIAKPDALRSAINNAKDTYSNWGDRGFPHAGRAPERNVPADEHRDVPTRPAKNL